MKSYATMAKSVRWRYMFYPYRYSIEVLGPKSHRDMMTAYQWQPTTMRHPEYKPGMPNFILQRIL